MHTEHHRWQERAPEKLEHSFVESYLATPPWWKALLSSPSSEDWNFMSILTALASLILHPLDSSAGTFRTSRFEDV